MTAAFGKVRELRVANLGLKANVYLLGWRFPKLLSM